jgi:hypothetical protein
VSAHPRITRGLKACLGNAIAFWEGARIPYNGVLVLVSLTTLLFLGIPRVGWTPSAVLVLLALVVVANGLYSLAYMVDLPMQATGLAAWWRRRGRTALWLTGTALAALLAVWTIAVISTIGLG